MKISSYLLHFYNKYLRDYVIFYFISTGYMIGIDVAKLVMLIVIPLDDRVFVINLKNRTI